jgi:uncharacterized membrane protein
MAVAIGVSVAIAIAVAVAVALPAGAVRVAVLAGGPRLGWLSRRRRCRLVDGRRARLLCRRSDRVVAFVVVALVALNALVLVVSLGLARAVAVFLGFRRRRSFRRVGDCGRCLL